jgi:hypothetical protein
MDFYSLKNELDIDPAGIGYSSMTIEQVHFALKANHVSVVRNVPLDELQAMLMSTVSEGYPVPAWWVIKSAATSNPVAEMAYDLFSSRLNALDVTLPTVQALLAQLVTTGVLTQDLADAIVAMSNVNVPRGEALFGTIPTILEIQFAKLEE